jgi:hypothetical protein
METLSNDVGVKISLYRLVARAARRDRRHHTTVHALPAP